MMRLTVLFSVFTGVIGDAAKSTCKAGFIKHGETDGKKINCAKNQNVASKDTDTCASATCANSDKAKCCLANMKCNKGFGVGEDKFACPAGLVVSATAYCEDLSCKEVEDEFKCCVQKCAKGFQAYKGTKDEMIQCPKATTVSGSHYCKGSKCAESGDSANCCVSSCTSKVGWQVKAGTEKDKSKCSTDTQKVNDEAMCLATTCDGSEGVCCQEKCSVGFKAKGASGSGVECGEDLSVHATAFCEGDECTEDDAGTCCQAKCSKGWKAKGSKTDEPQTCPDQTTVKGEGKCEGSPCRSTDDKLCCNVKCSDSKAGWKIKKDEKGKAPNICTDEKTVVSSKANCDGDCSDADKEVCCVKPNTTSTSDANSLGFGLVSSVATLTFLSFAL